MISTTMFPVRYAETDQMGVVHHAVYPVWYEAARTDLMLMMGTSYQEQEEAGIYSPVIEIKSKYRKPVKFGQDVAITAQIKRVTPAHIEIEYEVYIDSEKSAVNLGSSMHTWVGRDFKLVNIRKERPELYQLLQSCQKGEIE